MYVALEANVGDGNTINFIKRFSSHYRFTFHRIIHALLKKKMDVDDETLANWTARAVVFKMGAAVP